MTKRILEIAAFCAALIAAVLAVHAWLASRDDQQRLESTLAAQKKIIDTASANEQARDAALKTTLAQIAQIKSATQTPAQILRALPGYLPLPQPISMVTSEASDRQGTVPSLELVAGAGRSGSASRTTESKLKSLFAFFQRSRDARQPTNGAPVTRCQRETGAVNGTDGSSSASQNSAAGHLTAVSTSASQNSRPTGDKQAASAAAPPCAPVGTEGQLAGPLLPDAPTASTYLKTPAPGATQTSAGSSAASPTALEPEPLASAPDAEIPGADLKPLFDYVQDCRSCQVQLKAASQNQADDTAKILALTRERDAAITASKSGGLLRHLRTDALWFAVGAGVSAATYTATRH